MSSIDRTEEPGFSDRRESDRKKLIVELHFEGGDGTGIANTTDISLGGLFMKTNAPLVVGRRIALRLTVAGRQLVLEGEVVYAESGNGVGVSFIDLSEEKKLMLENEFGL